MNEETENLSPEPTAPAHTPVTAGQAMKRDISLMLEAAVEQGIPMLIGSCGGGVGWWSDGSGWTNQLRRSTGRSVSRSSSRSTRDARCCS